MSAEPSPRPVAVVDCGTNTTRLLIDDGDGLGLRLQRITSLGRGAEADGRLGDDAIGRVLDALGEYREVMSDYGVQAARAVATSAARDAANGPEFLQRASDALGVEVEMLDGPTEARYSFAGATSGLYPHRGGIEATADTGAGSNASAVPRARAALVLDIGGGSTEFAYGTLSRAMAGRHQPQSDPDSAAFAGGAAGPDGHLDAAVSVDMGSVRWTERFFGADPPRPEELSAAISVARLHLDDIDREHPVIGRGAGAAQLVGVAGTITTVAAVEIGLDPYDPEVIDGFVLTRAAAEDVFRTLATERLADRIHNPGLHPDRAPVIVGGCCILVAVMRHWDIDDCIVRERDLLDGIAAELREAQADPAAELREAQADPAAELREGRDADAAR